MSHLPSVPILFHQSQFPAKLSQELLSGLRTGRLNHKFLYESQRQTAKWLALHQACSPSRTDPECSAVYQRAFELATERLRGPVHLIGLGCGGGKKDAGLLRLLQATGATVCYTAIDVGSAMVLTASNEAARVIPSGHCERVVCDLSQAPDLDELLASVEARFATVTGQESFSRVLTFFGMIPNFRPSEIMPALGRLVRKGDMLLFSANLAPGGNYLTGVRKVLPQYDNPFTREWLLAFLDYTGITRSVGDLDFSIEEEDGLQRITANLVFKSSCVVEVGGQQVRFEPGIALLLFYSFRHTPASIRQLLQEQGMNVLQEWVTPSEEEGVFSAIRSYIEGNSARK